MDGQEAFIYTMPQNFMLDQSVPARWRLLGLMNGFLINGLKFYATNEWIMSKLNCSEKTVSNAIKELEKLGEISVRRKGTNRVIARVVKDYDYSNQLQSRVVTNYGDGSNQLLHNSDNIIQKYNSKYIAKDKPLRNDNDLYSFQEFYKDMKSSRQRHINVIGEYADTLDPKPNFTTRGQWKSFVKRHLRAAQLVSPFTDQQIEIAYKKLKKDKENGVNYSSFTLETIHKYLTK